MTQKQLRKLALEFLAKRVGDSNTANSMTAGEMIALEILRLPVFKGE